VPQYVPGTFIRVPGPCFLLGTYYGTELIAIPFNNANHYPYGGWTLYPGQAGSGVPSASGYSHVNALVPPVVSARGVLATLQRMGVPIVPPEPVFLGKNPCVANNVKLPVPKAWREPPKEQPREELKDNQPKKMEKNDKDDDDKNDNDKDKNGKDKDGKDKDGKDKDDKEKNDNDNGK
jgi:hypothetical protein